MSKMQSGIIPIVVILLLIMVFNCSNVIASHRITLTSTLSSDHVAYPLEKVNFTCTTRGANIQEWYSDEYITSEVDNRIQLHEHRRTGRGRAANATIISIETENGRKVIVSELCIIISSEYLMPTVSCGNNGLGMRENFTFTIQTVILNSTLELLHGEYVTYPHQRVHFTCKTTGAEIQEWYSVEYILSETDDRIQLHQSRRSGSGRAANATIIHVTNNELGEKVIVSRLTLIVSTRYPVSTITCGNNGLGMTDNITFNITDPPAPRINSSLPLEGTACPGKRIEFECVTLDSNHLIWTSDNYTGSEGIYIRRSLPIGQPRNSTVLPSTSAELVSKSEVNGRLQLTSRLTITASDESATDQTHSVTCSNNVMDASSVTFHVTTEACDSLTTTITTTIALSEDKNDRTTPDIRIWAPITAVMAVFIVLIAVIITMIIYIKKKEKGKEIINPPSNPPSNVISSSVVTFTTTSGSAEVENGQNLQPERNESYIMPKADTD